MDKIIEKLNKELEQIEVQIDDKGFTKEKLEITGRILEILKDAEEIKMMCEEREEEEKEEDTEHHHELYKNKLLKRNENKYSMGEYLKKHINKIYECIDMYEDGKNEYLHNNDEQYMIEGLEKIMYGISMFIETILDFSETHQEKEIIRRHIHKLKNM